MADEPKTPTSGTHVSSTDGPSLYLFPLMHCFSYDGIGDKKYVRIQYHPDKARYEPVGTGNDRPSGLPNFEVTATPENLKKTDYFIFADGNRSVEKELTVCYLHRHENGEYSPIRQPLHDYRLSLLSIEDAPAGIGFEFDYLNANGRWSPIGTNAIHFTDSRHEFCFLKIKVKINVGNGSRTPQDNWTFQIKATVTKPVSGGGSIHEENRIMLTYSPYKGWTLTKEGKLMQGKAGWLIDEKEYYILKDGRRVTEAEAKKPANNNLRFGKDDVAGGLDDIFGKTTVFILIIKSEYTISESLRSDILPSLPVVVFHAFQISICYEATDVTHASNCRFWRIGTDETDIPIVVTQIGSFGLGKKRIVIAGPHGDERNAIFAILETQKNFIVNRFLEHDLILFFIPATSPTMFFADARGLPFVGDHIDYSDMPDAEVKKTVKDAVNTALRELKIEDLHDKMLAGLREDIRKQGNSLKPTHGIDSNRDVHNLLPSTVVFFKFVTEEAKKNVTEHTTTVFMMHGYENARDRGGDIQRDGITVDTSHGTLCGPYMLDEEGKGFIAESIMNQMDVITTLIYGYRYVRRGSNTIANRVNHSRWYFFKSPIGIETEFNGEWSRKFYLREGVTDRNIPVILCFDIELGQDYNEGVRATASGGGYSPAKIKDRSSSSNPPLPFFNQIHSINTRFVRVNRGVFFKDDRDRPVPLPVAVPFCNFLLMYYDYRNKQIDRIVTL